MSNRIKKIFGLIACLMAFIIVINPVNVFATSYGEQEVSIDRDVQLDDSHSIHIHVDAKVSYAYDEDVYGWITNVEIYGDGGVGSDNVNIETLEAVEESDYGSSAYVIRYLFCGHSFLNDYRGYINIHFECNEWGDINSWLDYEAY